MGGDPIRILEVEQGDAANTGGVSQCSLTKLIKLKAKHFKSKTNIVSNHRHRNTKKSVCTSQFDGDSQVDSQSIITD
jgi:hypothetical protein